MGDKMDAATAAARRIVAKAEQPLRRPTIDELEKILQQPEAPSVAINPDGSIGTGESDALTVARAFLSLTPIQPPADTKELRDALIKEVTRTYERGEKFGYGVAAPVAIVIDIFRYIEAQGWRVVPAAMIRNLADTIRAVARKGDSETLRLIDELLIDWAVQPPQPEGAAPQGEKR